MSLSFWESDIFSKGEVKGEAKLCHLIATMMDENKIEEVKKVVQDSSYRQQMYEKYGILE